MLLRIDIINDFVEWIKTTEYEYNPNIKGEQRYTIKFYNEMTSMIKNITKSEFESDKHYTSKITKGGKGYFVGLQLNE